MLTPTDMGIETHIGAVLRLVRKRRGMSLLAVAGRAGTTFSHLSYIERGLKSPSSELLWSICQALRVPMSTVILEASRLLETAEERRRDAAA